MRELFPSEVELREACSQHVPLWMLSTEELFDEAFAKAKADVLKAASDSRSRKAIEVRYVLDNQQAYVTEGECEFDT